MPMARTRVRTMSIAVVMRVGRITEGGGGAGGAGGKGRGGAGGGPPPRGSSVFANAQLGRILMFMRNRFAGSYFFLIATSFARFAPYAIFTRSPSSAVRKFTYTAPVENGARAVNRSRAQPTHLSSLAAPSQRPCTLMRKLGSRCE